MKKAFIAFALHAVVMVIHGLVLSKMWGWFIAPLGLPTIGLLQGAGIACIIDLATLSLKRDDSQKGKSAWIQVGVLFLAPLVELGIGYLIHFWMVR